MSETMNGTRPGQKMNHVRIQNVVIQNHLDGERQHWQQPDETSEESVTVNPQQENRDIWSGLVSFTGPVKTSNLNIDTTLHENLRRCCLNVLLSAKREQPTDQQAITKMRIRL